MRCRRRWLRGFSRSGALRGEMRGEFSIVEDGGGHLPRSAVETLRLGSGRAEPPPWDGFRMKGSEITSNVEREVVYEACFAYVDGEEGEGAGLDGSGGPGACLGGRWWRSPGGRGASELMMRAISEVMSGQERTPSLHRDWARVRALSRGPWRLLTFPRVQVDVAAANGEAVRLADGGDADDFEGEVEVPGHSSDDDKLLGVLLSEVGAYRAGRCGRAWRQRWPRLMK